MPNPEAESLLRERIDELTTRLLISDAEGQGSGSEQFFALLAELALQARKAGYGEVANVAYQLHSTREEKQESTADRLRDGLERIQQALEEARSAAAAPAPAPAASRPPEGNQFAHDPEIIADFILESREHLSSIEQRLLTLERDPANAEAIHSIFRGFHTIKGVAGFLEFPAIQEVAHEVETALNLAREGKLAVTSAVIDVILESVDSVSKGIVAVESTGNCRRLESHDRLLGKVRALMAQPSAAAAAPAEPSPAKSAAAPPPEDKAKRQGADVFRVRVDTAKLDYLVDMVGEMVIAQSIVRHNQTLAAITDPCLHRDFAQLERITSEVQKTAMAMRMVPVGQLFQRTARLIRDLSRKMGKQVELVTRGDDIELDKTIAEELADPLMHMVRNSIDHGVETPGERQALGKNVQAKITLAAYHQAGQITVEVADDGKGLNKEKILSKARQRALIEDGSHLSETDIFRLIMEPGFSTADAVTDISGRGVGMDVVRKQVEKLRGRIEIHSRAGEGTTFLMKLPLTLAIIDGLVVTVGRHRYIVPLFAVREMFRPASDSIFTVQDRQEMALVRGRLLPVVRLYKRFGIVPRAKDPCQALLIVAETEGQPFCLMVDELVGKQEVVIKSLGEGIGEVRGIAGGAILGDGRVGLILDMAGVWGADASA
ncbi:MAG: chemotaxis protein CheA [Bryobacterales bacterium]|nr:chemotaxis protein CheA [Bryobacterales bacterium]